MTSFLSRPLRNLSLRLLLGLLLMGCSASLAQAQYKHHGIGLLLGTRYTFNVGGNLDARPGTWPHRGYGVNLAYFDFGFEYQYRFVDHWTYSIESHVAFHSCLASQAAPNAACVRNESTPITLSIVTELRYLFLTDEIRPYLGFGLGYWGAIGYVQIPITSFGPSVVGGLDWFFHEEFSLGFRMRYGLQLLVDVNGLAPFHQLSGFIVAIAYL